MMGNPSTRRIERITKQSDGLNWRSRRWEKPILEDESPSLTSKTKMSIKLEDDDERNQRSRLKEIIKQRIQSQSITQPPNKSIEEIAQHDKNERDLRSRLKKGIMQRTEPLSIIQTPFIKETETVETTEEQTKRRELIHVYSTSTMEKEENE